MAEPPSNFPEPIVFGPDFPQFKMLMRDGRQLFESRTNQNLFLNRRWDYDEAGAFTFACLLRKVATYSAWDQLCPLLFTDSWYDDQGQLAGWEDFVQMPAWDESEPVQDLLGYCQARSQRKFFLDWLNAQYRVDLGEAWAEWKGELDEQAESEGIRLGNPLSVLGSAGLVWGLVEHVFDFPAVIPEVWLNYVGYDKTAEDEAHLLENPQRVDFVVIANGSKSVIEIDGPSHYADFDETSHEWSINERKYAKNLAIERSLRRQGWGIYRFANVEVDAASTKDDFIRLVEDVPGFSADSFFGQRWASRQELRAKLGDAERFAR